MAGEQSPGVGSGAATPAAGTPPAPVGGATPAAPAATPAPGAPGPAPRVIPEDVLPEQLRGRTPQEIRFILGQMATSVATQTQRIKDLEAAQARPLPGIAAPVAAPGSGDGRPAKPIEERILEEPKEVILEVVRELIGPTAARLETGLEEVTESLSARDYDDWSEVKDDVYALLREAGAPKTKANIEMAYDTVIGRRARVARRLAVAAANNPDIPHGDAPPVRQAPELTGLEKEIFESSGMTREQWDKMGDSSSLDIRVPTGKRKGPNA